MFLLFCLFVYFLVLIKELSQGMSFFLDIMVKMWEKFHTWKNSEDCTNLINVKIVTWWNKFQGSYWGSSRVIATSNIKPFWGFFCKLLLHGEDTHGLQLQTWSFQIYTVTIFGVFFFKNVPYYVNFFCVIYFLIL